MTKLSRLDKLVNEVGPGMLSEFSKIYIHVELEYYLRHAMIDRLGRVLTADETKLIEYVTKNLQKSYDRQCWKMLR